MVPETLIVNASPLIFLGNAGRIDLLRLAGATRVLVPQAVVDEVIGSGRTDPATRVVAEADWIERLPPMTIPAAIVEWDLGSGESAVIAASLEIGGGRPVIDDLSGRKCARAFGLNVMGTLGVVIAAYRRGVIEDPRQLLLDLRASGMWLSDAVLERALRLAGLGSDRPLEPLE